MDQSPGGQGMLRKFLLLLALLVLVGIGLVATNVVDLNWREGTQAPLEVKVNPVNVGTSNTTVTVPVVRTETRQVQTPSISVGGNEAQTNGQ
jgi:hypothetical protein